MMDKLAILIAVAALITTMIISGLGRLDIISDRVSDLDKRITMLEKVLLEDK